MKTKRKIETQVMINNKKINILCYFIVFMIPIIAMVIHMAISGCYPFGNNTILIQDSQNQYYAYYQILHDIISGDKSLFFNFDMGMGSDMYFNFWYYLSNPFTWLILLFGKTHIELGMIIVLLIETGACGVTALVFFRHTRLNSLDDSLSNRFICMACSLAYSMCNFILSYQCNMMWLPCLAMVPIIMLAIEKLIYDGNAFMYIICLFLSFLFNFYFSWFVCLFAVIWFIDCKKNNIKDFIKKFVIFAGSSVLSAIMAAFVLIPCFLTVISRSGQRSLSVSDIKQFGNIGDFFQGFLWGQSTDSMGASLIVNNNYCGVFVVALVALYIVNKNINLKQKLKRIVEIALMVIAFNWLVTIIALQGFHKPVGVGSRFVFILVIILIVTAFEECNSIGDIRYRHIGVATIIMALFFFIMMKYNSIVEGIWGYLVSMMIVGYIIICVVLYKRKSISKKALLINISVIAFLEIISNDFVALRDTYEINTYKEADVAEWDNIYADIKTGLGERKTSWMYDHYPLYYYSETDRYSSGLNSDQLYMFKDLGGNYLTSNGYFTYRGTTPLTNVLYNVRYVLAKDMSSASFGGYHQIENYGDYSLYEADYIVGYGYVMEADLLDWNMETDNPFEVQNALTNEVLGCGDIFEKYDINELRIDAINGFIMDDDRNNNKCSWYSIAFDTAGDPMYTIFSFQVNEDVDLYMYALDDMRDSYAIYIDGELVKHSLRISSGNMIHVGNLHNGNSVDVYIRNYSSVLDEGNVCYYFYKFNSDVMKQCTKKLSDSVLYIDEDNGNEISGHVDVKNAGVLYTSMPYNKGFKVYLDGEETEIYKAGDGMIAVYVNEGYHEVVFKYSTYGLTIGIIISCCGFVFFIILIIYKRKTSLRQKKTI